MLIFLFFFSSSFKTRESRKPKKMWTKKTGAALLLAAFLLPLTVSGSDCGAEFQQKCICSYSKYIDKIQYVVNCTNSGFKDTSMLEFLPVQTEVLIFTGNYIPELPWNVFGAINELVNLTIVDMSNNHIREIRGKSYHHVQNVKRLILNHNNLTISSKKK